jgi:hypothetical protein
MNPTVLSNSNTFQVFVVTPFQFSANSTIHPKFPIIDILFPVNNLKAYATSDNLNCSSYNANNATQPGQFFTNVEAETINAYLQQWIEANGNLDFDTTENALVLKKTLGHPVIGSNSIIKQVSYDGQNLNYTVQFDLTTAVAACSDQGAQSTLSQDGIQYQIPLSYIEQGVNDRFSQVVMHYEIAIDLSGKANIGSTAAYHRRAYPLEVIYPTNGCAPQEARMQITYRFEIHDVFSSGLVVGPRTIDDIDMTSPVSPPAPETCYGDQITAFSFKGCSDTAYFCSWQIVTQSRCRVLTPDGEAFNKCSYAKSEDRMQDMGSDTAYPTTLDAYHTVYVDTYACDTNQPCTLANQSPLGYPDQIKATIVSSNYLAESLDANPFQLLNGFLPTPNAPISLFQALNSNALRPFDGNIFSNQPITIVILLPAPIRQTYDLRLLINAANLTILPLDALGRQLTANTTGYTGNSSLHWSDIALTTLFTTKNAFDDGCGAQLTCGRLSVCNGILGCDGFSVPVAQLRALMPANGYRFLLRYKIGFPGPDGSPANARHLLSLAQTPVMRRLLQTTNANNAYIGNASFSLSIDATQLPVQSNSTGVVTTIDSTVQTKTVLEAFYISDLAIIFGTLLIYPLISQCSKTRSADKYYV